jgi:hypothetical protein
MKRTGVQARVGMLVAAAVIAVPMSALAQAKGHSDRSVQTLMEYTWGTIPTSFRTPNGDTITIDKTKKKDIMIPLEKAKEVVGVADRSARAQYCGLMEEQDANFQTMMRKERLSEHWSPQQLVFITLLHATTVAYMTGTMKFQFGEDGQKDVEIVTKGPIWTEPCTDDVREKIKTRIMAYIDEQVPADAGKAVATKSAEPVSTKKK